jgi:hypothetical protein
MGSVNTTPNGAPRLRHLSAQRRAASNTLTGPSPGPDRDYVGGAQFPLLDEFDRMFGRSVPGRASDQRKEEGEGQG